MAAHMTELRTSNNYFDLSDILASQEKIPCVFTEDAVGMGYLDQSTQDPNLAAGTKLDLPFWLARDIHRGTLTVAAVETPKVYSEGWRQILAADPAVVDLHKQGPHFYLTGSKLAQLRLPDVPDILKTLLQTFQGRFRSIMDGSQHALHSDIARQQTDTLDEQERLLFAAGQRGLVHFLQWESREGEKLATSEMVSRHRKRKRVGYTNSDD